MRVGLLLYGSLDTVSGGYLYDRKLVGHLRAQGDEVRVFSLPWRNYAAHLTDNLHFRLPPDLDILIEDELNHPSLLTANAHKHPYPVISLVHNLRSSEPRLSWQNAFYRGVEHAYLKSVDGFIFNSKTTRDSVQLLAGFNQPYVIATPAGDRLGPGLDVERVRSRATETTPLRLLFLGNLIPLKGLHILLQALIRLPVSSYTLDVVGSLDRDPGYVRQTQQRVVQSKLSGYVHFHGTLDGEPLVERLTQAQVLVLPSLYEGFGIVYLEGMAFGLPAIATTSGAAGEIITDGENGFLIPPDDPVILAARLRQLVEDRELLGCMSHNALNHFHAASTWEQGMSAIREFLLQTVSRGI